MQLRFHLPSLVAILGLAGLFPPTAAAKDREKPRLRPSPVEQLWKVFQEKHPGLVRPRHEPPPRVAPVPEVQLVVVNNTGVPVDLVWVQPHAGEVNYGSVQSTGRPHPISTSPGHVWVFKTSGHVFARYEVNAAAEQEVVLRGRRIGRAPLPPPVRIAERPVLRGAGGATGRAAFLKVHNDARAAKGVAPLEWSADCAAAAQEWAQILADRDTGLVHSRRKSLGENIWQRSGGNPSPDVAADDWLAEQRVYRGERISETNFMRVGHYTQMVWSGTTSVGFGYARAASGNVYIVANYFPPGNFLGQRPYERW